MRFLHSYFFACCKDEMLMGMKRSVRGSIRQAPNVFTWIQMLTNMKMWGDGDSSNTKGATTYARVCNAWHSEAGECR